MGDAGDMIDALEATEPLREAVMREALAAYAPPPAAGVSTSGAGSAASPFLSPMPSVQAAV